MLLLIAVHVIGSAQAPWVIGMAQLHRLDLLPAFKRTVSIGAVTSYDRSGGNDDGFSGKYSFVRKEGDDLVLADLKGPGCIYRIHTPTPTDDPLEFYFDGESTPRIRTTFRKLYEGAQAPFVRPLVDVAGGGYTCYVPIPYKKSCKLLLRARSFQFYDLNYATYPADAPVTTFDPNVSQKADIDAVAKVFGSKDLTSYNVPAGTKLRRHRFAAQLQPGKSVTLFEAKRPGRIASIRLGTAEALGGKDRDILLRVTWDNGKPAVLCPAGDFFGYAWGKPAMGACLVGTDSGVDYCNFPMPYDHAAKIELVSLRSGGPALAVSGEVVTGDTPRRPYEGKFYAVWRRENPTTEGKPFTYLATKGRGHIVGLALQAQGMESGNTSFFEGDDVTTIDGEMAIHGTGSEDSFNGGWYDVPDRWDGPVARPLSGCLAYQKPLARTGGYRFFIGDAYSYRKSIVQTIEHAPEGNRDPADYCSVTYLYSENPPTADISIPSKAARQVVDPKRIVFTAHWTLPIASFAFNSATLSRKDVPAGNGTARCLSLPANGGGDFFGPPFIRFTCDLPAGRYKVSIDAVKGPEEAIVQLSQAETPLGASVDLYSAHPEVANGIPVGEVLAPEGGNNLMFKLVGKNAAAIAWGFDLVEIVFERLP